MLTIESLKAFGVNTEEGVGRCLGKPEFYLRMVGKALEDTGVDRLDAAIAAKDYDEAFRCAHAMKGVFANLSLTPLLEPVEEITELLRAHTDTDYSALMARIKDADSGLKNL
jgi:HPt (histidine-containing phosphotransfer) domain-containing protein